MALAQAAAGVAVVGPSGMMDGQVGVVRDALDAAGHLDTGDPGVLGEVRVGLLRPVPRGGVVDAAGRPPHLPAGPGQRPRGAARGRPRPRRGRRHRDGQAGAGYLDVLREVAAVSDVPVAAYQVSGEYAMVEAAAAAGWLDREAAILEMLTSIRRAGADVVLTYWAAEVAGWLR